MSQALPPFRAIVSGVDVLYLEGNPDIDDAKDELAVLEAFIAAWNAGKAAADEATALLVISNQHVSTYTPTERPHITFHICTATQWANVPKLYKYTIHVYSINDQPDQGYDSYRIHSTKSGKASSPSFSAKVTAAYNDHIADLDIP